ncbi:bifunctional proline dehydrogenase/L-glutamate gamma-semialdehyde dehydrogenase [Acaricomes phytoseiuli]|uniref:bifunctional proline dehydrogenase/L-glutamate gamma-semialdehyde dehydrogenase n=1 Tax=Acaricomes phytoseiuli TaxID=291968 RepID=UPI00036E0136|nr:bifunctional proline dehydrogenase/L-glutamate gamma-semialdehyde dehydrogenase [Acaricomes phytoseiuli]MCW1249160.1 bifunctional proline dehydrogenase/L-glutamate gamma-semialdehyde dehydrogenase [Acaricomes phytoseiuli]
MTSSPTSLDSSATALGDAATVLVQRWIDASSKNHKSQQGNQNPGLRSTKSAALLAEVLKDQNGLDFTLGFVDRVVRPEDQRVAARSLARLAQQTPEFLPWYMKAAVRLGGTLAPVLPTVVVPIAKAVLRRMVAHLIVDARPRQLGAAIAKLRREGTRLNINLLGEAVLGDKEADARLAGTRQLLQRPDVDYVSIKVSSVVSQLNMWAFDESVQRITKRLLPLYLEAAQATAAGTPKFINLDMEEYRDLDLTVAVFKEILAHPELKSFEAGIVLQAYLPDALAALQDLTRWSQERQAAGGTGIKVRLVKGANLAMEQVDADIHGWALATVASKQAADTNYKLCLDWALQPANAAAVRLGVAGHNLFDIAYAHLLAEARGVTDRVEFEMLLGMAEDQTEAVRQDVGSLLLYTPVVKPQQFDVAISYLIRRLEENASSENFMSAVFELGTDQRLFEREKQRFLASLAKMDPNGPVPQPNRQQDLARAPESRPGEFVSATDSDPALPLVRAWGREVLAKVPGSRLGKDTLADSAYQSSEEVEELITRTAHVQPGWAELGGSGRAAVLRLAAQELSARRGELIEVSASETGKVLAEADVEISEAVDFANYYALSAERLEQVSGARFVPSKLTVVTPPWNFPIAITAGSILAPLAAGSAVIIKPAPQARRCAAIVVKAIWAALDASGVCRDVLILADVEEGPIGQHLISHQNVDRVILTGAYETAELFRSWRDDLPLLAETSGKNAIIVTPSADPDLAAKDVVKSAFGHAGQKCSAASLVILVGSMAESERFRNQLIDAASSLKVGLPEHPETEMGPIIEPAAGKLASALTTLGEGESWLVKPRKLDDSGRLYSPGVRTGVRPGSYYHLTEFFGPVLGIMTARNLEEAIELQNASAYGLTAGLHTMDPAELTLWLDRAQAGNLYVNRGITGAIVQRQPFGGWKRSSVGAGAKAGGPNYLVHLGDWAPQELPADRAQVPLRPAVEQAFTAVKDSLETAEAQSLRRALGDDAVQWAAEFGVAKDVSGLSAERNVFRYLPVPVEIRGGSAAAPAQVLRIAAAGYLAGSPVSVSLAAAPTQQLRNGLIQLGAELKTEETAAWAQRVAQRGAIRVRLIGDAEAQEHRALLKASDGSPELAVYTGDVTEAGRVELLPFLHEQAVSITAHRFGNPDNISDTVLPTA